MPGRFARTCALLLIFVAFAGCSDDPVRPSTDDHYQGSVDPDASAVVLKKMRGAQLPPLDLILVGDVAVHAEVERVSFRVAIHNSGSEDLVAPVVIRLGDFRPDDVIPFNSDWPRTGSKISGDSDYPWGYAYADFGGDGLLAPGETSSAREWIFFDPGLAAFSFGVQAELSGTPSDPAITGLVFHDDNFNGRLDDFEMPYGVGAVQSTAFDGTVRIAPVMPDGRYRFAISKPGLYELFYDDFTDGPWCTSTPNPLVVVVPPAQDGGATSYDGADFGYSAHCGPDPFGVFYTDRPLDEFRGDPYQLLEVWARQNTLVVRIGYSACHAGHPFLLVVSKHIMESLPPQVMAVLQHDNQGDVCRMWQEEERSFDLSELVQWVGGPIYVRLVDHAGVEHKVLVGGDGQD